MFPWCTSHFGLHDYVYILQASFTAGSHTAWLYRDYATMFRTQQDLYYSAKLGGI